jgi:hypothetical protein
MPNRLTNLLINRVAFVPKGDNPGAEVVIWKSADEDVTKAAYTTAQRVAMAKKGEAIPVKNDKGDVVDGRYPIGNVADLKAAQQALGRSGSAPEVIAHIKKRATALGQAKTLNPAIYKEAVEKEPRNTRSRRERLQSALDTVAGVLNELTPGDPKGDDMPDTDKEYQLPDDASDELKAFVEGLQKQAADATAEVEKLKAEPKPDEPDVDPVAKALADSDTPQVVKDALLKAQADATAATETAKAAEAEAATLRDEKEKAAAVEKARTFKNLSITPEDFGPVLQAIEKAAPDAAAEIERVLTSADSAAHFREIGRGTGDETSDSYTKLKAMGDDIAKREGVTEAVGFSKALETDEGKALHNEYRKEVADR